MMWTKTDDPSERLAELLRANDPGADAPLDSAERTRLRSRMLVALDHGRQPTSRRLAARWWVGSGAAAMLALALLVALWRAPGDRVVDGAPDPAPSTAAFPRDEPRRDALGPLAAGPSESAGASSARPQPGNHAPPEEAREPVTMLARAPVDPRNASRAQRLEMRFVAPGGTRIIWTLDPNLDLGPESIKLGGS